MTNASAISAPYKTDNSPSSGTRPPNCGRKCVNNAAAPIFPSVIPPQAVDFAGLWRRSVVALCRYPYDDGKLTPSFRGSRRRQWDLPVNAAI